MINWKRHLKSLAVWLAVWIVLEALGHGITRGRLVAFLGATVLGFGTLVGIDYLIARRSGRARGEGL